MKIVDMCFLELLTSNGIDSYSWSDYHDKGVGFDAK